MKELGISINKILKDWLQSNGEGDIVFTDDIAINEVTDEIVTECRAKYDELLRQRDELREALAEQKRLYFNLFDEEVGCMYCEAKLKRGSAIILCKGCAENTEL